MDIFTKGHEALINGEDAFLGVAVSQKHIIVFEGINPTKIDKLKTIGTVIAIAASPGIATVGFLGAAAALWGAQKINGDEQFKDLQKDIDQLKSKFKLSEEQILISNNKSSSVTISGGGLMRTILSYTPIDILIEGNFYRGPSPEAVRMVIKGGDSKRYYSKFFGKHGYATVVT